ncbi:hypothetical protein [Sediminitomix flava]|nr:hypothetical protein [Sediminitomix flava]
MRQIFVEVIYDHNSEEPDEVHEVTFKELTPYIKAIRLPKEI